MNLVLLDRADADFLAAGTPAAEHLSRVLKISRGGTFWCGVKNGARGLATVREIFPDGAIAFSVAWEKSENFPEEKLPPVRLLVGLSRPQTMKKVFAAAGEIGCSRIDVFQSEKGDPAYAESSLWKNGARAIGEILEKAAEQTCTTAIPPVRLWRSLENFLAGNVRGCGVPEKDFFPLALDVYAAEKSMAQIAFPPRVPALLAIGSERGWSEKEREILRGNGFVFAHLGGRVLRVETAVAAALSVALSKTDFWRPHRVIR